MLSFLLFLSVVPVLAQSPSERRGPSLDLFPRQDSCNVILKDEDKLGASWQELVSPASIPGAFVGYRCVYCSPITTLILMAQDTKGQGPLSGALSVEENTSTIYTNPAVAQRYLERVRAELMSAKAFCDLEKIEIIGTRKIGAVPMIGVRYEQRCKAQGWPERESAISFRALGTGCYFEASAVWEGGLDLEPQDGQWNAIFSVMSRAQWQWQSSLLDRNTPTNRAHRRTMREFRQMLDPPPAATVGPNSGQLPPVDKKY